MLLLPLLKQPKVKSEEFTQPDIQLEVPIMEVTTSLEPDMLADTHTQAEATTLDPATTILDIQASILLTHTLE